jgi:predicted nucleic acid-binding protein
LFAPAFLALEVTNAIWIAVKLKRLEKEDAQKAIVALGNQEIYLHEFSWNETSGIFSMACKLECAVYDAAYLFLAEKLGLYFITSDTKLYEKAKGHFQILHLEDFV